jgi:hypothetical protein
MQGLTYYRIWKFAISYLSGSLLAGIFDIGQQRLDLDIRCREAMIRMHTATRTGQHWKIEFNDRSTFTAGSLHKVYDRLTFGSIPTVAGSESMLFIAKNERNVQRSRGMIDETLVYVHPCNSIHSCRVGHIECNNVNTIHGGRSPLYWSRHQFYRFHHKIRNNIPKYHTSECRWFKSWSQMVINSILLVLA